MALLDSVRSWLGRGTQYADRVEFTNPEVSRVMGMSAEELYRTQPHLRIVISFLARNIAQLGLHTFIRTSETDRRRTRDDPLARVLSRPNTDQTQYELMYATVSDYKLYDYAVWSTVESSDAPAGWDIRLIPPTWIVATGGGTAWAPDWIRIGKPSTGELTVLERDQFLLFHGYRPGEPTRGSSPVDALRQILAEQVQAWTYREQVWQRGGRVGTVMTRPANAPVWSDTARTKFQRDWASKWTGPDGPKAGGTPILEDGMTLQRIGFTAREDEWSEVAKLSLATVAAVYHTSPTMVGILDNANFSNVKEFSRMLYTDTLGPDLAMFEKRIDTFLAPRVTRTSGIYVQFNVAEKMQGSFEEQAAVVSTSVGRPWMTADEARARFNMPALGGDAAQLVTPLNVLVGGQASPRDSGTQNLNARSAKAAAVITRASTADPLHVKSGGRDEDAVAARQVLVKHFRRQRAVVLSALGAKAANPPWWDADRWNTELSDDLYRLAMTATQEIATDTLDSLGVSPDEYDPARTEKFLRAVADSRAAAINSTTRDQILAVLAAQDDADDDEDEDENVPTVADVFDTAETSRADQSSTTLATTFAGFAVTEAARQLSRPQTTKTWVVNSSNPRPEHAAMDGETVPIDEQFSNGADWPGDPVLGAEGVANCNCSVDITIP